MAARAASGYPSPAATAVTLGRHSEPMQSRSSSESHARPAAASESLAQPHPRRPSPPPLVRTDHVPRAADPRAADPRAADPRADPRADLMIDTRLDPRAQPGHPYYASARPPVTPPSHRAVGGGPPGAPGAPGRPPVHHHPYHAQPTPVPLPRRQPQPESSSRPKSYPQHHLSHTSSAALPPPPPAASPRGPLPSSAPSEPPPAHAHQPKVLHLNSEQVKSRGSCQASNAVVTRLTPLDTSYRTQTFGDAYGGPL